MENPPKKIQTIHMLASKDVASVETAIGGGQHDYLFVVVLLMNHVTP